MEEIIKILSEVKWNNLTNEYITLIIKTEGKLTTK